MAFEQPSTRKSRSRRNNQQQDTSWKADAFINISMPKEDGSVTKIGTVYLKDDRDDMAELIDWLSEDPTRVHQLKDSLVLDFRLAEGGKRTGFALPGMAANTPTPVHALTGDADVTSAAEIPEHFTEEIPAAEQEVGVLADFHRSQEQHGVS